MNVSLKKAVAGTMAALIVAFAAVAPASAGPWPHPWHPWHYHGWGPYAAAGVIGFAAGAAIASEDAGCIRYRPMYDNWGNYIGQRAINVCY
ncbi:MAG: hypothetical protein E7774_14685 [Bradyrhizobium sp.]|nr:MAG: hypothetical protein E7774_14685 [Bradyrhizobium sp.]